MIKSKNINKIISAVVVSAMLITTAFIINFTSKPQQVFAEESLAGETGMPSTDWYTGNEDNTEFTISTADELAGLGELVNDATENFINKTVILGNNIDLSVYGESYLSGKGWLPIGVPDDAAFPNYENVFHGTFDGNNKTITGLYINDNNADYCGLFGFLRGFVKNLGMKDVDVEGRLCVGGLAGQMNGVEVKNCYVTGIVKGTSSVGGMAGYINSGCKINECYSTATVNGAQTAVGGLVGSTLYGNIIKNCYTAGTVSAQTIIGGIVGEISGYTGAITEISYCFSAGDITGSGSDSCAGGILGSAKGEGEHIIKNCIYLGETITADSIGRIVGNKGESRLSNNYALSTVEGAGDISLSGKDGADISAAEALKVSFWTNSSNWDGSAWNTKLWSFKDGALPEFGVTSLPPDPDLPEPLPIGAIIGIIIGGAAVVCGGGFLVYWFVFRKRKLVK